MIRKSVIFATAIFASGALAQGDGVPTKLPAKQPPAEKLKPAVVDLTPKATLDLEWEPVKEADGYEVELTPKGGGDPLRFTSKDSSFSQALPLGTYKLRIRSKESSSGVYGEWSDATEVDVESKQIGLIAPESEAEFEVENGSELSVDFKWSPGTGAKTYTLRVWPDEEPDQVQEFKTQDTAVRVKLTSMKIYHWNVTFETDRASYAVNPDARWFIIKGPKLSMPTLDDVELPSVTEISWSDALGAEDYEAILYRRALDETEWKPFMAEPETKETVWHFDKLTPGAYRIEVTAHSSLRTSSDTDFIEFVVKPTKAELIAALRGAVGAGKRLPAKAEVATTAATKKK